MLIVIWCFIILIVLYLVATCVIFQLVCRRFTSGFDPFKALTHATDEIAAAYPELMEEGRLFFETHGAEPVSITSFDGLTLRASLYEHPDARAVLVACHGYRSDPKRDFGAACGFYYGKGISILLIDERACGQSEGKYITFGIKERLDVQDWCAYALSRFPDKTVYAAGISMGATAVLMAVPELSPDVPAVLADCGFVSPWDELAHIIRHYVHLPAHALLQGVDLWCRLLAGFSLRQFSTVSALEQDDRPILLLHGEADELVPFSCSVEERDACKGPVDLFSVPDAGHGISYLVDTEGYQQALNRFLHQYVFRDTEDEAEG